jgi:hypothetical protein
VPSPLGIGDFVRQPALRADIARLGATLLSPTRSQVTVDSSIDVVIDNPYGAEMLGNAHRNGSTDIQVCDTRPVEGTEVTVRCGHLGQGQYEVDLFGALGDGSYLYIGSIWVNAR